MEIREVLARNLRILRQAKGLSQEELAHSAGIDRTYISSLERSIYNASIDVVDRLATVLDVKAMQLLDPDTDAVMRLGREQTIKTPSK
ncbi:helix-turn-helix domain-containing protein [Paracoccus xiamenensis]|uniref:helix-turn-helix domain-containing protein n=1 Tax=Paracoccus xiamenensis TaxID=2714901 RepID=UPI00140D4D3A|nr:helix-turn-helix transcriptional regulator [Paracoccus xiamenensis]NHF74002.1 helix-turn-helix transcriptional regulator [Paracoccus xiamenensis]